MCGHHVVTYYIIILLLLNVYSMCMVYGGQHLRSTLNKVNVIVHGVVVACLVRIMHHGVGRWSVLVSLNPMVGIGCE